MEITVVIIMMITVLWMGKWKLGWVRMLAKATQLVIRRNTIKTPAV